ncbi:hypothetical protein H2199_004506 [Coniosporium tulheliwenetii]|uniref:Uncharacterized protein n=1 Tax=Coniosporium tulheliwenetii TaxID=3383036 RepID=A0ACC2Z5L0_9PEZI|nr:hypothetical protein H2199_004506 [Cladosporium sp. JES 115]
MAQEILRQRHARIVEQQKPANGHLANETLTNGGLANGKPTGEEHVKGHLAREGLAGGKLAGGEAAQQSKPERMTDAKHPGGRIKHGFPKQAVRMVLFGLYFLASSQLLGTPLYLFQQDWYYAWMAFTKQHFGLLITTMTQWWSPTLVRISGDETVRGQLRKTADGRLECDFPERLILIANHQIYTDWLYLWWIAYTDRMHGHVYIILKESLKWIPILGWGMQFFSFVFLSRNWTKDKPRFQHRLRKLNTSHHGPLSGSQPLDPMWLMIFPEGTNLSKNGRASSKKWADKNNIPDLRHVLLPRSTGLLFCLQEMRRTVDWVYDCTLSYEGIPRGLFGQDIFTLRSTYFQGRPPKSVNMHWRRFAVASIPLDDPKEFEEWVHQRWVEKDELIEHFLQHGRFPADEGRDNLQNGSTSGQVKVGAGYIETEVKPVHPLEFLQMFVPVAAVLLVINVCYKVWHLVSRIS